MAKYILKQEAIFALTNEANIHNNPVKRAYTRAAELMGSVRALEKERDKLTKKNRGVEIVRCKDCVKLNRYDCPLCYIENKTLQFAEVKPNFFVQQANLLRRTNNV